MTGVACALLRAEHARRAPWQPALLPRAEATGQRCHILVAQLLERARREGRPRTRLTGDHDRSREVGDDAADARLEVPARDVHGVVDRALVELVRLAHVDEDGRLVGGESSGRVVGADLVDLRLELGEKILVGSHAAANATWIAAIPSRHGASHVEERGVDGRLTLNSERTSYPARVSAGIDRKRALSVAAAGALVVAAVVLGALALRSPAPAAAPRSSAPLSGAPPLVLDLPARPRGGEAALAAVSSDIAAGRRGSAETALRRARALLGAGDMRVQVAGALLRYRPGEVDTSIGVLRALVADDDRAPVPALHLGLALLWSGQRAEATAELQETRSLDPDGLYGRTADNVLHRRIARTIRSGCAPASCTARFPACARGLWPPRAPWLPNSTTPTRCSSARVRERDSRRRRRWHSTRATSTLRWP